MKIYIHFHLFQEILKVKIVIYLRKESHDTILIVYFSEGSNKTAEK